ncbi:hypothetical protein SKAU_G00017810 [Synaphobranchus kaupii]|uniref:Uncharacterized protein n=1 Tax=Synaphobranchus kaupii TaxID=118154 RepID=A0A9Q1GCC5_SYNKA|nr:hypothetical protein SKAU_G00017810 [Synaphobranchus kaupii]
MPVATVTRKGLFVLASRGNARVRDPRNGVELRRRGFWESGGHFWNSTSSLPPSQPVQKRGVNKNPPCSRVATEVNKLQRKAVTRGYSTRVGGSFPPLLSPQITCTSSLLSLYSFVPPPSPSSPQRRQCQLSRPPRNTKRAAVEAFGLRRAWEEAVFIIRHNVPASMRVVPPLPVGEGRVGVAEAKRVLEQGTEGERVKEKGWGAETSDERGIWGKWEDLKDGRQGAARSGQDFGRLRNRTGSRKTSLSRNVAPIEAHNSAPQVSFTVP